MSKVREDKYSIYVKVGGYVARPVRCPHVSPLFEEDSEYCTGDTVYARHLGGSSYVRVGNEDWAIHGSYFDENAKQVSSEKCWDPTENSDYA